MNHDTILGDGVLIKNDGENEISGGGDGRQHHIFMRGSPRIYRQACFLYLNRTDLN